MENLVFLLITGLLLIGTVLFTKTKVNWRKGKWLTAFVFIFAVFPSPFPQGAWAEDITWTGTADDDEIYFGVIEVTDPSTGTIEDKVIIYQITNHGGASDVSSGVWDLDAGRSKLVIYGLDGNDRIQGLHDTKRFSYDFIDIRLMSNYHIYLHGNKGHDTIIGSRNTEIIYGEAGNDLLNGDRGRDYIRGGEDNDYIVGGSNNDILYGDDGNDILIGYTGLDYIDGGRGTDTFRCREGSSRNPIHDPADCDEDCDDGGFARKNIERNQKSDPYRRWAYMTDYVRGSMFHYQTTSSTEMMLVDRAAGASILMTEGGDLPVVGDFNGDGFDDVGVFRSANQIWAFNYNNRDLTKIIDGITDGRVYVWGENGDRPVAGRFNQDDRRSRRDGVALFRPATHTWHFDYDLDGRQDREIMSDARGGDIPIAGDFDGNGTDDIGWFRPSNCQWYLDLNLDGDFDFVSRRWGNPGDIPVAGDFNGDGRDDIAVFRPGNRTWYYHWDLFGVTVTNDKAGPWAAIGDIPFAGDFDNDGICDVGVFRLKDLRWYFDIDHDGDTDPNSGDYSGPWGWRGTPLHTIHKQYDRSCGPASLAMVMDYLGFADRSDDRWWFDPDLDLGWMSVASGTPVSDVVHVGYWMSMEHIMYEGFINLYEEKWKTTTPGWFPKSRFVDNSYVLNTDSYTCPGGNCADFFDIEYPLSWIDYNPLTGRMEGDVQNWMKYCEAVGTSVGNKDLGLAYVANMAVPPDMRDALPVSTDIPGRYFTSLEHLKTVLKNYIDNGIPLVIGVDRSHHFNTLVGYWQNENGFYLYTADPLDGWGRDYWNKPMRWRKIKLTTETLDIGAIQGLMLFGHTESGCGSDNPWAERIVESFGGIDLCNLVDED